MTDLPQADWTDTLHELARFASDHELPAPLTVTFSGDDAASLSVAVSGPGHAAWFDHFGQGHRPHKSDGVVFHSSNGDLPSGAFVTLTCLSDSRLPSAVAVADDLAEARRRCEAARWPEQHSADCAWCKHLAEQRSAS